MTPTLRRSTAPAPLTRRSMRRPRSRGQSMVEFALVVPIFLLILCGILDLGVVLYSQMTVISAAREGARVATTMTEDPGAIPGAVQNQVEAAAGGLDVATSVCRIPKGGGGCGGLGGAEAGDSIRVVVTYDHHAFFPLLFGATIPMSSQVQMVLE
jgi:Flp pilus assembly protein TadG